MDNLRKREKIVVNGCTMCLRDEESVDHIMLNSTLAQSASCLVEKTKFLVALWVSISLAFRGLPIDQRMFQWEELAFS